jgi:hypothetical protein
MVCIFTLCVKGKTQRCSSSSTRSAARRFLCDAPATAVATAAAAVDKNSTAQQFVIHDVFGLKY